MTARTEPQLTSTDRRIIAKARAVAKACGLKEVGEATGTDIDTYPEAFGAACYLLLELAAIADRLDDDGA